MTGFLVLEDGTTFRGESVGADAYALGEAVFTTAMTGYQEVVTDPSYAEQLVCFTAPMIGNYGVAPLRNESRTVHARAAIMREARGPAWTDWLTERGIPALSGIDTRSLVQRLREGGAMRAAVVAGDGSIEEALRAVRELEPMEGRALAGSVSTAVPYAHGDEGGPRIAVLDYGCKRSIVNRLAAAGAEVVVYPHDTPADALLEAGAGGRAALERPRRSRRAGERDRGGAAAARAGAHPRHLPRAPAARPRDRAARPTSCASATGGRITRCWSGRPAGCSSRARTTASPSAPARREEATHVSLYDGTVEGLDYPRHRARSFQFHPEAGPGPHDARPLIESWVKEVRLAQAA